MPWLSLSSVHSGNARFAAVAFERRGHLLRHHVEKRTLPRAGRHDVIDRRERAVRICDLPSMLPEHVERLRRRDFVDEMQSDEQLRLSAGQRAHGVQRPTLSETVSEPLSDYA